MANHQPGSYCGGPFQTNGYLLTCGSKQVLFDAPQGVTEWLQNSDQKVDLLILTHLHHDHVMDVEALVKSFKCPVWSHSDPSDELIMGSSLEVMTGQKWDLGGFTIDRHLDEGDIEIDGRSFTVLHIPGHSPDSLCFYDPKEELVIGGDVLFQNSIGRTDFPNGNHQELIDGIKDKLWPLSAETMVYPGHGPPTNIGFEKTTNSFLR